MNTIRIGEAGLKGWRAKVADSLAQPISNHSSLSADQTRAAIGVVFFALALVYVVGTVRRLTRQASPAAMRRS